jgi:phosphoglycolate phosphatase
LDKKLVIFDLDGTLIDSVPDLASSVNFMLKSLGREEFSEDIIRFWVGNGAEVLVRRALSGSVEIDENIDKEILKKAMKFFLSHYNENLSNKTYLYPNVKETLEELKSRDYFLTIVTNKPFKFVKPILEKLEIIDYFPYYLGADSLDEKKPSPKPLLEVCKYFEVDRDKAIMVGDSKNDILAANNAKMDSIAVKYGYNYGENISKHKPTFEVDDIFEITKILKG